MNRNDFLNMMSESVPLNRQLMGEVYELIDIFPYFQSAHLLLLKGLKNNSDVKFENQLRNSAIHIADREVLYYLLKKPQTVTPAVKEVIPENYTSRDTATETQQTVIESAKNSTDLINEIESHSGIPGSGENQDESDKIHGHSILIASETDSEEPAGVIMLNDEENTNGDEKIFFMDPGFSVPEEDDLLELDLDTGQDEINIMQVAGSDLSDFRDMASKRKLQSDLIDKFIIANPRIEPNREKTTLQLDEISKPPAEEEGGFVTETLAKIYISQQYYSKAIEIYEKLSLKFPEKSSYFASQIEKVKEYIKK